MEEPLYMGEIIIKMSPADAMVTHVTRPFLLTWFNFNPTMDK